MNQGFIPTIDNGTCLTLIVDGCTDNLSINYNPAANVDNGLCITEILGCTDSQYLEFNASANTDDNTCATLLIFGCTDNGLGFQCTWNN
ncbi:MAG: hypothetical protein CM15mP23_00520 [Cryomorphaceae bacterium]|nr:MAG: hypothetical protein CM15mP23_00520 [Cryomorphaceae bacterium]